MSATKPLRVGVLGTGFIGRVHVKAARAAGAEVVAVSSSTRERAAVAAAELGVAESPSAEELVQRGDLDLVHICTPNDLHAPLARLALESGRHVICEKPLATSAADAAELAELADATGLVATVPFVYRFYPTVRLARLRVREEAAGRIALVHGSYLQDWMLRQDDDSWRVDVDRGGATRAFGDIGSHWCDLAEFVTGHRIVSVSAVSARAYTERLRSTDRAAFSSASAAPTATVPVETEDAMAVLFTTDQGATGSCVVSQVWAGRKNRLLLEVDGLAESITFNQEEPETLLIGRREEDVILRRDPGVLPGPVQRFAGLPAGHPEGYQACFDQFVADTYTAVRTGALPDGIPTFRDGLRANTIAAAVVSSAASRRWVDVPATVGAPVAVG